jgi:hypothetical protein
MGITHASGAVIRGHKMPLISRTWTHTSGGTTQADSAAATGSFVPSTITA